MTSADNLATFVTGAPAFGSARLGGIDGMSSSQALVASARQVADALRSVGIGPDEPVVVFVSNVPADITAFLGIWQAGGVAVPVHVGTPQRTAEALIARLGARFAIRDGRVESVGQAPPPSRPLLQGAALIVFTSGSTGQPKGVVLGHAGLVWKLQALARLLRLGKEDVVAVPLQLTFIFGIWASLLSLASGAQLMLAPGLLKTGLGSHEGQVSVLAAVPTLLRNLCGRGALPGPALRMVLTGGEPCGPELASALQAQAPGATTFDLFGLTETGSCDFCARHPDAEDMAGTLGWATEGVAYRVQALPELSLPKGVGELQIKTPAGMLGYLDDPAQTAAAFADGYFRTGDLATVRDSGLVQLVGRSKDIVSRGGNKIAPLEIENLFAEHPGVAAALAFGMPDDQLGERLHLMVVSAGEGAGDSASVTEGGLRAWAADRLERFKTPDVFHFVQTLPVGRTGKADRAAARAEVLSAR
ncbi:MAG: class I adenylate-forming enzyme family protein [Pseudomonadota bacterium]